MAYGQLTRIWGRGPLPPQYFMDFWGRKIRPGINAVKHLVLMGNRRGNDGFTMTLNGSSRKLLAAIRDRHKSKRLSFCGPGSRFAWPG